VASDKTYVVEVGYVQFDPIERSANGKDIKEITIKAIQRGGKPGQNFRITLWPELAHAEVEKGDFVSTEGTFTTSTYQDSEGTQKTSLQISAYNLHVNGVKIERKETERVVSSDDSEAADDLPF
jgi:single-stranded DNA-binding protein